MVLQKRMGFFPPRGELSLNSSADITWVAMKPEDNHCHALLCYSLLSNKSVTTLKKKQTQKHITYKSLV